MGTAIYRGVFGASPPLPKERYVVSNENDFGFGFRLGRSWHPRARRVDSLESWNAARLRRVGSSLDDHQSVVHSQTLPIMS
jgi:hypothetical protein